MFRFIGDMVIGWILFTDSGKKTINKLMDYTYKKVKSNIMNSPQIKELLNNKKEFTKEDHEKFNSRTKN
jgi:hypothetical protein